jgi:hypothetical protein
MPAGPQVFVPFAQKNGRLEMPELKIPDLAGARMGATGRLDQ